MSLFIIVPVIITSIVGLISISSFSNDYNAEMKSEEAQKVAAEVSDTVNKCTDLLDEAVTERIIKEIASRNPDFKERADALILSYIEKYDYVHDILITDTDGYIFISGSNDYADAELFFDPSLVDIAASPTPTSNFYDNGRFYIARPVEKEEETVGYIVLIAEEDLIDKILGKFTTDDSTITITISDEIALEENLNNEIEGTRWYWSIDYPASTSRALALRIWITALGASAGVSVVNIIIMLIVTRKMTKEVEEL
jgi:heme/copper-type cytochrome/quinol oxidase subunit 2